jgi:hypothetical protein
MAAHDPVDRRDIGGPLAAAAMPLASGPAFDGHALRVAYGENTESVPTTEVVMSSIDEEMVLAHFIVSDDVERSRRFYTDVLVGLC